MFRLELSTLWRLTVFQRNRLGWHGNGTVYKLFGNHNSSGEKWQIYWFEDVTTSFGGCVGVVLRKDRVDCESGCNDSFGRAGSISILLIMNGIMHQALSRWHCM